MVQRIELRPNPAEPCGILSDHLIVLPRGAAQASQTGPLAPSWRHLWMRPPVHMDDEAGHESLLPPAAPSPAYPPGHTRHPSRPVPATATVTVSVELQHLPAKATHLPTPQASSDDGLDLPAERAHDPSQSLTKTMSRVPLLVRSSPAQGTGKLAIMIIVCDTPAPLLVSRLSPPLDGRTRATAHKAGPLPFPCSTC